MIFAAGPRAPWLLLAGFILAGTGIGFAETAESTMVAQLLPGRLRGNGVGVLGLVQALGDLASWAVVGLLWATVSPEVGFAYDAFWMLAAIVAGNTGVSARKKRA